MNSPLSVLGDTLNKNPICVLNEFSLKTSSKISFEYRNEDSEFLALVVYNNQIIGTGKDKKKQVAKTKAAEDAVNHLSGSKTKENKQEVFDDLLKKFGKKGNFKLSFQDPIFIYEYFLSGSLIAEGRDQSETLAKEKCVKHLNEKLTIIEVETIKKSPNAPRVELHPPLKKKAKLSDIQVLESSSKLDPFDFSSYFEELLSNLTLSEEDLKQLSDLENQIKSLSKALDLELIPIGSYALGQLRKNKLVLDFCLVVDSKDSISGIFESLEKARMIYLKYKESEQISEVFALSYSPRLVKKGEFPHIQFENDGKFSFCFFFSDDPQANFLQFYSSALKTKRNAKVDQVSIILKHWRALKGLQVKSEVLDILARDVTDERPVGRLVRQVVEMLAAGVLLDGNSFKVNDWFLLEFAKKCGLDDLKGLMIESTEFLTAFHQKDLKGYLA